MSPPKLYTEPLPARFAPGTKIRIRSVLKPSEVLAEFVRVAVERELLAREDKYHAPVSKGE